MPASGTFQYVTTVPALEKRGRRWPVELSETIAVVRDGPHEARLVGLSPYLEITDAGVTPNPSISRPAVLRSRLTLIASDREHSTVSSASFYIDKDLTGIFEARDKLHIARTNCAGLGLSLLRNDQLIFAVGAISGVPLGNDVRARIPRDLVQEAAAFFKKRDPKFGFFELPVEISVRGRSRIRFRGWETMENYNIWLEHGFIPGIPGVDECAAIALQGSCEAVPASGSAQLLNSRELEIIKW